MPGDVRPGREDGLGLLELVIAILVLSLGTMAALTAFGEARRGVGGEAARLLAMTVAHNRAEELALVGAAAGRTLPRQVTMGPHVWQVDVEEDVTQGGLVEATIRVSAPNQPGAVLVAYVRDEEPE